MVNKSRKFVKDYSLIYAIITIILLINMNIIAVSSSNLPKNGLEENNLENIYILEEEGEKIISQPLNLGVGIFWWKKNDSTLDNTRLDTQGFANYMVSKGFSKDFEVCEYDVTKYKFTEREDQDYFEQTDFVYYAGHGYHNLIKIDQEGNLITSFAYYWECSWGNEGPVKWVGLASCNNTENEFKVTMNGINMILGWSTWCDDKQFGETLAKHCTDDEMSIKESWFATAIEKSTTRNLEAKILGENSATGNDCIYNGGEFVGNVDVTNQITYWKCPVNHFPNLFYNNTEGVPMDEPTFGNPSSSQNSETLNLFEGGSNIRGDPTAAKEFYYSLSNEDDSITDNPKLKSQDSYYIPTDNMSVVFPTILVSENDVYTTDGPDLSYEKANWESMARQYMIDNGLLDEDDVIGVDYDMNMVPQKQGFSNKRTKLGIIDQNEYFKEWDIALNVFVIRKINETEEKESDPPTNTKDEVSDNIADQKPDDDIANNNDFKSDDKQEFSYNELKNPLKVDKYQKTTVVISPGKKIGYSFTTVGEYNEDEHKTGGDDEL